MSFTAGSSAGAGSVTLTLFDSEDQSASSTAVVDVQDFPTVSVAFNIDEDETWTADNIYILVGRITVLTV